MCGFNLQHVQLMGEFWVFLLSHIASGFQLWVYFHLCTWVIHWGFLLRLPWRTWVGPCEVWRWCSCLSPRGSGGTRYSGELGARAAGNIVCYEGMATSIGPYTPVFLPGEPAALTENLGRPQSTESQGVGHYRNDPACIGSRLFCLRQHWHSES